MSPLDIRLSVHTYLDDSHLEDHLPLLTQQLAIFSHSNTSSCTAESLALHLCTVHKWDHTGAHCFARAGARLFNTKAVSCDGMWGPDA